MCLPYFLPPIPQNRKRLYINTDNMLSWRNCGNTMKVDEVVVFFSVGFSDWLAIDYYPIPNVRKI